MIKLLKKLLRKEPQRTYIGCFSNDEIKELDDPLSVNELEERAA